MADAWETEKSVRQCTAKSILVAVDTAPVA